MKRILFILFSLAIFLFASCSSVPTSVQPNSFTDKINPNIEDVVSDDETDSTENDSTQDDSETQDINALNEIAIEKADNAREAAIASGADKLGKAFEIAEKKYENAKAIAEEGKDARNELAEVAALYNALEKYANAISLKKQIDSENLSSYDMDDYNRGNKAMAGLDDMFKDEKSSASELLSRASSAADYYTKVLNVAYRQRAIDARAQALIAKRKADSVMAGVARKTDYVACVEQMTLGDGCFSRKDAANAYTYYIEATKKFDALYDAVAELRAKAQEAMEAARKSVAASEQYALDADESVPITDENLEGIEDADAVLIEVEEYDDPKNLEANIPDTIEF